MFYFFTQMFSASFLWFVGNKLCIQGNWPHCVIVYIGMADLGPNVWETQAKVAYLKPFPQRKFWIFKQVGV